VLSLLPTTASETNQCSGGRLLEQLVWQTEMTSVDTHGCLREARRCYLRWDLLGLLHQRQAEQRPGVLLADVLICQNGFCAKASSRIPLSRVRDHVMESGWVWSGDCGRRLISAATASRSGTDIELLELVALVASPPQGGG
jgi:hypothetical protein